MLWATMISVGYAQEDAHSATHDVHLGSHGANAKPEEFKTDLAIYTFVVFIVLMVILRAFAWKPITKALDERERRIADDIAAAMRGHEDAKKLLAQYEARLAAAQDEVRAIIEEGRKQATHLHDEILAKAREDAVAEMNRAKRDVETARDQALQQLAETSANLAVELAGKIVHAKLDAKEHGALIDEAVRRIAPSVSRN
jgi:F-type H+-transporting ATPase subunit b